MRGGGEGWRDARDRLTVGSSCEHNNANAIDSSKRNGPERSNAESGTEHEVPRLEGSNLCKPFLNKVGPDELCIHVFTLLELPRFLLPF